MIVVGRREEEKMFRCGPEKVGGVGDLMLDTKCHVGHTQTLNHSLSWRNVSKLL
jgi:hypothetical protein